MLGCFNPTLGQIWTNPNAAKIEPNGCVCPYLTQSWVKTTQRFLTALNYISCFSTSKFELHIYAPDVSKS